MLVCGRWWLKSVRQAAIRSRAEVVEQVCVQAFLFKGICTIRTNRHRLGTHHISQHLLRPERIPVALDYD